MYMDLENIRTLVLGIGWPVMVIGGTLFFISSYHFYLNTKKLAIGKMIITATVAQLVSMLSLGAVATVLFFVDINIGMSVVLPIFVIWFTTMVIMYVVSRRWTGEAEKINILYYKIKERSEQLEQEKGKLIHVADNMPTGAILLDSDGKILFVNRETKNILGFSTGSDDEVLGALYQKFSEYNLKMKVDDCIKGKPSNIFNAESNGKIFEIFLRNLLSNGEQANAFGHFIWIRDVTEETLLERARSKFVTVASHKLRTPLTGIKLSVEMLSEMCNKESYPDLQVYINNIIEAGADMSNLVDQLLHVAAVEKSEFRVNKKLVSLPELIEGAILKYKKFAEDNGCSVTFTKNEEDTFEVMSDEVLLSEALEALLDNAIRYNVKEGNNTVNILLNKKGDSFEIVIKDTGSGIPTDLHNQVFSKFFRSDSALKVFPNGLGVNLSITKDIIKSLDGKISFESVEGEGTTFKIEL